MQFSLEVAMDVGFIGIGQMGKYMARLVNKLRYYSVLVATNKFKPI
jgi:3-hydroxyisobutyrate dehydrogenase-like beta-hydroxyacid dehydrogenase